MKTRVARWLGSAFVVAGLVLAAADIASPGAGAQSPPPPEEDDRCGGMHLPKCATMRACKGILWWKKCVTRSIYFPPPN